MHISMQRISLQTNESIIQTCNLLIIKKLDTIWQILSLPVFNILKILIRPEGQLLPCILQFDLYLQFRYRFNHCLKKGSSFEIHFTICNFEKTVSQKVPPFGVHCVDYIVYLHLESSFGPLLCVPIGTTNRLTACRPQMSP